MPTPLQIKLIHIAKSQVGLNDPQYRNLLRNVGGVASSKQLDQAGVEDVMAVLEDSGFVLRGQAADYWRDKVRIRGSVANPRMTRKIHALAAECRYALAALCLRMSEHRADRPEELHPREAWNLIEAMKAMIEREDRADGREMAGLFGAGHQEKSVATRAVQPASEEEIAAAEEDVPF